MAPPGRRRRSSGRFLSLYFLFSLLAFLLLAALPVQVSAAGSAIIGIDLGTEYIKAALVKPGVPLEIVLTKDSKRKEAAAVAFKPAREQNAVFPERFYGGDALSLASRFPDDVFPNLKVLLGIPFNAGIQSSDGKNENAVEIYRSRYPAIDIGEIPHRGTVGIKSNKLGEDRGQERFMVEELLAMQLKQVKANAEAMGDRRSQIEDAVITFPPFYTAEEKRSVELSAELAGLNVIAMISDGLAVGVNYATSRTFPSVSEGNKPEYHAVYDMGAGCTSATVLRFQSRSVKDVGRFNKTVQEVQVIGSGWDKTLGGDALNQLIVDDMIEKFLATEKLKDDSTREKLRAHGRTMAKLWKEAERVRHVLSANSETTASFEGLYHDDVNFKYQITRSEFEKLSKTHAARVSAPLIEALASAKLSLKDLDSVILHGGAIRTPFVQKELESTCKGFTNLRSNVNADEAAVFGATFKGAALSRSFRVKDIRAGDSSGFAVGMKWKSGDKEMRQNLFTPYSTIGTEKQVTMNNLEDFDFSLYQQLTQNGKLVDAPLVGIETTNLTQSVATLKNTFGCAPANITTKLSIQLRPLDGIPELVSAIVSCQRISEEKKGVVEDVKEFFGLGSKKNDQQPLQDDPAKESVTPGSKSSAAASASTTTASSSAGKSASASSAVEPEIETSKGSKGKTETIPIAFNTFVLGIKPPSETDLARIKGRLTSFDVSDYARFKREEVFNNLEAFIYQTQELVDDEAFLRVIPADDLAKLKETLAEASEWLYGDGTDATLKDIKTRLDRLKQYVDPALKRKNEYSLLPSKIEALQKVLRNAKTFVDAIQKEVDAQESIRSSSESASPAASTPSNEPPAPSSSDDFVSLEDESTSTTTTNTPSPKATQSSLFAGIDVSSLANTQASIMSWLEKQLPLQEQLSQYEDPILTTASIEAKLRELELELNKVMTKMTGSGGESRKNNSGRSGGDGKSKQKTGKEKNKDKQQETPKESQKEKEKEKKKGRDEL
ncbi:hsp70-like protein [Histoplasma capsulatum G186AR]|uniref:Hsp70-like protein n=2 Tax=Ajellomyces capsulatus TaxID=5037 RepID=C0NKX3_AJECG|nr:hsp70-like protein [Histoplasma capsulatum G186AR]EEH08514.1 hsp70-like protein [Histoplasma capsulatum G186AR]KAG5299175.1 hsp70-like protein [Histoplasma capsulatum]QSS68205.1 hsp70-like protein [Histoplasma capsulatum G186AR]